MASVATRKYLPQAVPRSTLSAHARTRSVRNTAVRRRQWLTGSQSSLRAVYRSTKIRGRRTARVVVHASLGEHGVVLNLGLAERGSVVGDDNQLGCFVGREEPRKAVVRSILYHVINIANTTTLRLCMRERERESSEAPHQDPSRGQERRRKASESSPHHVPFPSRSALMVCL